MANLVYQAKDGSIHKNYEDASFRDLYCSEIDSLRNQFAFKGDSESYIQRTVSEVDFLIRQTRKILARYHGEKSELVEMWDKNPRGLIGRILGDSKDPIEYLYWLLRSIDKKNRQWQQPCFAEKADKE